MSVITESKRVLGYKTDITFYPNFFDEKKTAEIYAYLFIAVKWPRDPTKCGNKRTNVSYGDPGLTYEVVIRGKTSRREVLPWSDLPFLKDLCDFVAKAAGVKFNYVVIQCYPNKKVGMIAHRDKEVVKGTTIAGLSFGAKRVLTIINTSLISYSRPGAPIPDEAILKFLLPSGSLYLLHPPTNDYNMHCIELGEEEGMRISLTFRLIPK